MPFQSVCHLLAQGRAGSSLLLVLLMLNEAWHTFLGRLGAGCRSRSYVLTLVVQPSAWLCYVDGALIRQQALQCHCRLQTVSCFRIVDSLSLLLSLCLLY